MNVKIEFISSKALITFWFFIYNIIIIYTYKFVICTLYPESVFLK